MTTLTLPKRTSKMLTELTGEVRSDAALILMMRDLIAKAAYARYKLAEI